jgi:alpha-tubulin suppressor-like RCC1 family protein
MARARRRSGLQVAAALGAVAVIASVFSAIPAANAAPPIGGLVQSSSGGSHTCAVTASGGAKCWGWNLYGQIGDDTTTTRTVPTSVFGLSTGVAQVAAGMDHTCAITTVGGVDCWGRNDHDQVGPAPTIIHKPSPVPFPSHHVVALSLGDFHSCALLDIGGVKCWGYDRDGELGDGSATSLSLPTDVIGLTSGVSAISAYGDHTCALTTAGAVKCWGLNDHGQLGNGVTGGISRVPVQVTGLTSGVTAIALGEQRSCALTGGGAVECWGSGLFGQLGNGSSVDSNVPVQVTGLSSGVDVIAAGGSSTCALSTGVLKCWGYNASGQLGDATTTNRSTPVTVALGSSITGNISVGLAHACLQLAAGTKCWGDNSKGQLGDGTFINLYGPFLPDPPGSVAAVAADHSVTVSWAAPVYDGGVALTSYTVTSSPPSTSITLAPSFLVAHFVGLTNGVTYTFVVKATNGIGDSRLAVSNPVVPAGLPGLPLQLGVAPGDGLATVSWAPAFNNGSALTGYRVIASPGGRSAAVSGSSRTATIAGLNNGSTYSFTVRATNRVGAGPAASVTKKLPIPKSGYWMLGANGGVYPFGNSQALGSASYPGWASGVSAVAMAVKRDGSGYWVVDSVGVVHAFGSARSFGSRPALAGGEQVSTIAATPTGAGYWLFTDRGRAIPYGNAHFFGDMHAVALNGPVIASTATPTGNGYFMVASDGGVFTFGDARFHGSTGALRLNKPVVGLSATPSNGGYWLVASDGGVFAFGDAGFRGSMGGTHLNRAVNGLVPFGTGYLMVASDGGVFDFSDKPFFGSLGANPPPAPIIGIAAFTF